MRLIDADALQRRICGAKCGCEHEDCGSEGDCAFDFFIFHSPTIDAEPVRHGRWMKAFNLLGGVVWDCSECCKTSSDHGLYCPNCGAKMDLKGE